MRSSRTARAEGWTASRSGPVERVAIVGHLDVMSGMPIHLAFSGDAVGPGVSQPISERPTSSDQIVAVHRTRGNTLVPDFTCDPGSTAAGWREAPEHAMCRRAPFGTNGTIVPPYDLRAPWHSKHDLTVFKNFATRGAQRLQFRAGFFNIFNTAHVNTIRQPGRGLRARHGLQ